MDNQKVDPKNQANNDPDDYNLNKVNKNSKKRQILN